jgi:hypothetical protein
MSGTQGRCVALCNAFKRVAAGCSRRGEAGPLPGTATNYSRLG